MKKPVAILFFFLFVCSEPVKPVQKTIQSFVKLKGDWQMKEAGGIVTESRWQVNDTLMEGRSDFIKADSVISFETIRIYKKNDAFYYEAKAAGQNNEQPVSFLITSCSDSGFVAENPQHDFPKRITYRFINKDSVYALVDDGAATPAKKSDFDYSRKKAK
ncbi:MAG: hypothetical protein K2X48_05140 [Chitinophagaceae bacterium]|nr:hypothetical protein [Chitinophagaceae bacterium]